MVGIETLNRCCMISILYLFGVVYKYIFILCRPAPAQLSAEYAIYKKAIMSEIIEHRYGDVH